MLEAPSLKLGSWFSHGWTTFKEKPKQIIGGAVILSAFYWVLRLVGLVPGGFLLSLLGLLVVGPVLAVGWWFLCLKLLRGDSAKSLDIFGAFSRFGPAWVTFFLLSLIVFGGIILLIVPGIIWGLKYQLSLFAVMDEKLSAREAIRLSGKITKGHMGKLFGMYVVAFLLDFLQWPLLIGLQLLETDAGCIIAAVGIVPYLVYILVIIPWLGATLAAAYDSLVYEERKRWSETDVSR